MSNVCAVNTPNTPLSISSSSYNKLYSLNHHHRAPLLRFKAFNLSILSSTQTSCFAASNNIESERHQITPHHDLAPISLCFTLLARKHKRDTHFGITADRNDNNTPQRDMAPLPTLLSPMPSYHSRLALAHRPIALHSLSHGLGEADATEHHPTVGRRTNDKKARAYDILGARALLRTCTCM